MPDLTKIATCSYCGTRSVFRLNNAVVHELSCPKCGAPKHEMKALKVETQKPKYEPQGAARQNFSPLHGFQKSHSKKKSNSRRKKRSWDFWDVVGDGLEDIIEDIFD